MARPIQISLYGKTIKFQTTKTMWTTISRKNDITSLLSF